MQAVPAADPIWMRHTPDDRSDPTAAPPPETPEQTLERAGTLCDLCRFAEAATVLSAVISTDPRNAPAWSLMARAQLGQDQNQAALQAARAASSLAPEQAPPRRLASEALTRLDRHEDAANEAHEALRLAPRDWRSYAHLAHTLTHIKKRLGEAHVAATRATAIAPEEAESHLALGAVAVAMGRRDDAAEAFAKALALDAQNSSAHSELSRLRHRRRRIGAGKAAGSIRSRRRGLPHWRRPAPRA